MKRQLALLGGQLAPIYLGIRERNPEHVHLFYSTELSEKVRILEAQFNSIQFSRHLVDPYSFEEINSLVESLVIEYGEDEWELNLTGGTKVMTLAAHNIFKELEYESFYLDQKNRMFFFKNKEYKSVEINIKIITFLKLSGHTKIRKNTLSAFDKEEFNIAIQMLDMMKDNGVNALFRKISYEVKDHWQKSYFKKNEKGDFVDWNNDILRIKTNKTNVTLCHKNAFRICFSGLWWELVVAQIVRKWDKKKEMLVGVELLANSDQKFAKNEIDIILNTGKKMIFIECKSGNVKQEDINKMRVVKRLYGGISSRSILVCCQLPRKDVLEKCQDLGIDVFALQRYATKKNQRSFVPLSDISQLPLRLEKLILSAEI